MSSKLYAEMRAEEHRQQVEKLLDRAIISEERVREMEAFIVDLSEEAERCRAGHRLIMVSYVEKRIAKLNLRKKT